MHRAVSGRAYNLTERAHALANYKAMINHTGKEEGCLLLQIGYVTLFDKCLVVHLQKSG